jgi:hypothetical protein
MKGLIPGSGPGVTGISGNGSPRDRSPQYNICALLTVIVRVSDIILHKGTPQFNPHHWQLQADNGSRGTIFTFTPAKSISGTPAAIAQAYAEWTQNNVVRTGSYGAQIINHPSARRPIFWPRENFIIFIRLHHDICSIKRRVAGIVASSRLDQWCSSVSMQGVPKRFTPPFPGETGPDGWPESVNITIANHPHPMSDFSRHGIQPKRKGE